MTQSQAPYHARMAEAELQDAIRQAALYQGWLCYHTHDSRHSPAGFPDLCLVHPRTGKFIFWELKSGKGTVSPEQQKWLDALSTVVTPPLVSVVRPADLDRCLRVLARQ